MIEFRRASVGEADKVAELYDSVRGEDFCAWSELYPTLEHARADAEAGCLYVLTKGGEIIGCVSVEKIPEDNDLPFWRVNDSAHREIARVAVSIEHRGKGYAAFMVSKLFEELSSRGVRSIHLLAAVSNPPAVRTYVKLGFDAVGECNRYGHDYIAFEKLL